MCYVCAQDPSLHGQDTLRRVDYGRRVGKGLQFMTAALGVFDRVFASGSHMAILRRDGRSFGLFRL